jgi:hypothetical protein
MVDSSQTNRQLDIISLSLGLPAFVGKRTLDAEKSVCRPAPARRSEGHAMLCVRGPRQRLCEGASRRDFLQLGAIGGLGLSLPRLLRAATDRDARRPAGFGRAQRCVLLFLTGGPPQSDTWDPKPAAPAEYRGELRPIATAVPGVPVSELFPRTARQLGRCCLVRSVTHADHVHTSAGYTMLTGMVHPRANGRGSQEVKPGPHDHPHVGSLVALARPSPRGIPAFASLPEAIKDANVNPYPGLDGGLLGQRFSPWRVEADATHTSFRLPDIALPDDVTGERLADRRLLLAPFDRGLAAAETASNWDQWRQLAFALLRAPELRRAFLLDREPTRTRDEYGRHLFGQGCLLARRLLEAGISLVSVYWHYEGPADSPVWDTHQNNFRHLRERLAPPTDQALAALLEDLAQRGLLDTTLVVCMGEFGRTPRVNKFGGRDHWPAVQTVLLAGAGIQSGVYGSSDRVAAYPGNHPVSPAELAATLLHLLGVPPELELRDRTGRPFRACVSKPVLDLCS